MTTAVEFLWRCAGQPEPVESDGSAIPTTLFTEGVRCAATGLPAKYRMDDAISDSFTTVKNACRAWPFGGNALSSAAVWACKSLALRCGLFFASQDKIWFEATRPLPGLGQPRFRIDVLEAILRPPPPPFVAGLPMYGIDHGGESNIERTFWWEPQPTGAARLLPPKGPWTRRIDATLLKDGDLRQVSGPLIKLQSKHTALYCRIAYSRTRFPLQIDDTGDVMVDVVLWRSLKETCDALLQVLRAEGCAAPPARQALLEAKAPFGLSTTGYRVWYRLSPDLIKHCRASWWPTFVGLLAMPELA